MRKIFVMAAFVCIAVTGVSAQTEETESKNEKMLRLTKAADENPIFDCFSCHLRSPKMNI